MRAWEHNRFSFRGLPKQLHGEILNSRNASFRGREDGCVSSNGARQIDRPCAYRTGRRSYPARSRSGGPSENEAERIRPRRTKDFRVTDEVFCLRPRTCWPILIRRWARPQPRPSLAPAGLTDQRAQPRSGRIIATSARVAKVRSGEKGDSGSWNSTGREEPASAVARNIGFLCAAADIPMVAARGLDGVRNPAAAATASLKRVADEVPANRARQSSLRWRRPHFSVRVHPRLHLLFALMLRRTCRSDRGAASWP